ncbi:polyprenyl synthetase family protein [Zhenhengia yiwuensis]|uniref:Polyprenyl synthetase family protein n=1 Tax=Zhenhengia yiwuensis TaxID=2763666 RepID=A0A926IEI6_9FIRM|nr:polyprenyl synthetase family protein [Zhenhengia yiwuensis]MBC8579606.1 polyprenyl synthetase family protein [Zhenhengia yiwuensis]MBS5800796.1 polyprenyl synthetase family protein [Clostridiales bacterium]MDY3369695.1 polyprenyl synthetase family protein [Zhenhengia yiwuensis]
MHIIWNRYPDIKLELEAIIDLMDENAKCKDKIIENSIKELVHANGKMIRPAFTIIAAHFGDYESEKVRALSAVVELFHMATLVHDDVIDDAKLRRGRETIQSKYGKEYAVYIGDYLFCICFKILAQTASLQSIQMDSRAMSRICLGEIEQLNSRFDTDVSLKNYLRRIAGKTAELFSLSLYIGAAESGCNMRLSKRFHRIGHHVGMAFQIIDDILDYKGDEKTVGKDQGKDIREGVYNLPLIYALEKKPQDLINLLEKEAYEDADVEQIIQLVKNYEGIEKAQNLAKKYTDKAYKEIHKLPDNPYKEILLEIVTMLLERSY